MTRMTSALWWKTSQLTAVVLKTTGPASRRHVYEFPLDIRAIMAFRLTKALSSRRRSTVPRSSPHCRHQHTQRSVNFGYKKVPVQDKEKLVGEVFHSVAGQYDLMNDLMSGGIHRLWKEQFLWDMKPTRGTRLLDVAGGTGDIAFRFIEHLKATSPPLAHSYAAETTTQQSSAVVVCDINPSMLDVGRKRAASRGYTIQESPTTGKQLFATDGVVTASAGTGTTISFVEGNAERLPFEDNSFDVYSIAFGLRNVTQIDVALQEAHRVLKHGGRFMCLEFSHVSTPLIRQVYDQFSFSLIPWIGEVVAKDRASYQYLVESIRTFPKQDELLALMDIAGFKECDYTNYTFGVAALHSGFKL